MNTTTESMTLKQSLSMTALQHKLHARYKYDPESGNVISNKGIVRGTINNRGYVVIDLDGKNVKAHKIVWAMHHGEWPNGIVDHIDRDKTNNRIENLRVCGRNGNSQNRRSDYARTGHPKGVFVNRSGNFSARIYLNGVGHYLGSFKTKDEAAHAYNKAAISLHGDFACLNPIGVYE